MARLLGGFSPLRESPRGDSLRCAPCAQTSLATDSLRDLDGLNFTALEAGM